jgi:hypothetical protein
VKASPEIGDENLGSFVEFERFRVCARRERLGDIIERGDCVDEEVDQSHC